MEPCPAISLANAMKTSSPSKVRCCPLSIKHTVESGDDDLSELTFHLLSLDAWGNPIDDVVEVSRA